MSAQCTKWNRNSPHFGSFHTDRASMLLRLQHLKEKSRAKNFFAVVKRAVAKVYLCEKNVRKSPLN